MEFQLLQIPLWWGMLIREAMHIWAWIIWYSSETSKPKTALKKQVKAFFPEINQVHTSVMGEFKAHHSPS